MAHNILGAIICAAAGFFVAFLSYIISRKALENNPERFAVTTVLRQVVQIGYLIIVYFSASAFKADVVFFLVGAALGMTVPMFFFTKKLLALNESLGRKNKDSEEEQ